MKIDELITKLTDLKAEGFEQVAFSTDDEGNSILDKARLGKGGEYVVIYPDTHNSEDVSYLSYDLDEDDWNDMMREREIAQSEHPIELILVKENPKSFTIKEILGSCRFEQKYMARKESLHEEEIMFLRKLAEGTVKLETVKRSLSYWIIQGRPLTDEAFKEVQVSENKNSASTSV